MVALGKMNKAQMIARIQELEAFKETAIKDVLDTKEEYHEVIKNLKEKISNYEGCIPEWVGKADPDDIEEVVGAFAEKTNELEDEVNDREKEISEQNHDLSDLRARVKDLQADNKKLEDGRCADNAENEEREEKLKEEKKRFRQDWIDMTEEAGRLDRENKKLKKENEELKEEKQREKEKVAVFHEWLSGDQEEFKDWLGMEDSGPYARDGFYWDYVSDPINPDIHRLTLVKEKTAIDYWKECDGDEEDAPKALLNAIAEKCGLKTIDFEGARCGVPDHEAIASEMAELWDKICDEMEER